MSLDDGLVLQLHAGSWRRPQPDADRPLRPGQGRRHPPADGLRRRPEAAARPVRQRAGAHVVVYTLDESTYSRELAPLAGHYPALRLGPPWWFHDSPEGIRRFRQLVTETAGFANTVGFNDDARSLLSIPARHDMARRIDAGFLAGLVAEAPPARTTRPPRWPTTSPTAWPDEPSGRGPTPTPIDRRSDAATAGQRASGRRKRLDGLWDFVADRRWRRAAGAVVARPAAAPGRCRCPSAFDDVVVEPPLHDHVGDVWYQRSRPRPAGLGRSAHRPPVRRRHPPGRRVGRRRAGRRARGRLHALRGRPHRGRRRRRALRVTVVVNNELTWRPSRRASSTISPDGQRKQFYFQDFYNYAGLIRSVWLCATPRTHLADVTVVTDLDGAPASCAASTVVDGSTARSGSSSATPTATTVAEGEGDAGELRVAEAQLLGDRATATSTTSRSTSSTATTLVDRYHQPVGIRTVRVDGTRFLINGEPFYFKGFGMHEDLNVRGRGHDDAVDGPRLRAAGLGGRELVPDLALPLRRGGPRPRRPARHRGHRRDRRGGPEPRRRAAGSSATCARTTFTEETVGVGDPGRPPAGDRGADRPRQEPPVASCCGASPTSPSPTPRSRWTYFEPLFDAARAADPTRPVGFVNMMLAPPDRVPAHRAGRRRDGQPLLRLVPRRRATSRPPSGTWRRSCGRGPTSTTSRSSSPSTAPTRCPGSTRSDPCSGARSTRPPCSTPTTGSSTASTPWWASTSGTSPTSPPGTSFIRVDGNKKGVFTRDRRPKAAAHHLRRRWRDDLSD